MNETMTAQEIFDHVAAHLLRQNAQSLLPVDGACAYRGYAGKQCAVGCLIREDEYTPEMEGENVIGLNWRGRLPPRLAGHEDLLMKMQNCHDNKSPYEWPEALFEIADEHSLDPRVVYAKEG